MSLSTQPSPPLAAAAGPCAAIYQTAWRRRIHAELLEMQTALNGWPHQDQLSTHIRSWHKKFMLHIQSGVDDQKLFQGFFSTLQQILIDPIRLAPLDEPLLGKDGKTYGKKTLQIHLNQFPTMQRLALPFVPLQVHTLARHMIHVLEKWNARPPPVRAIEEEYAQLAQGILPEIPMEPVVQSRLQARIARIALQQQAIRAREQQSDIDMQHFQTTLQAGVANIEATVAAQLQSIRDARASEREEQNKWVKQLSDRDAQELTDLASAAQIYRTRVETLTRECQSLERERQEVDMGIKTVHNDCILLQSDLNTLEQEIAERNSDWCSTLLAAGGSIAICVAASSMLPGGFSASAMPGGAKLTMTFAF